MKISRSVLGWRTLRVNAIVAYVYCLYSEFIIDYLLYLSMTLGLSLG